MKLFTLVLFTLALLGASYKAQCRELVIGVSPYLPEAEHKATMKTLIKFLANLEAGDTAVLIDAYHLKTLGQFDVPEGKSYRHPKARIAKNRAVIGTLISLPKSTPAQGVAPSVSGAVRLPQFLRHVVTHYRRSNGKGLEVIVLGSPFYDTPTEKAFSMADGLTPNDGHIKTSRRQSLYGTADTPAALKDSQVHFGLVGDRVMQNDTHHYYVERFWTLYVAAMQGAMASYTADLKAIFSNVKDRGEAPLKAYKLEETERLEMIRIRAIELNTSIYERPLSTTTLSDQMLRQAQTVEVGLSWDCLLCDLDLYARPSASTSTLSFKHTRSEEGVYFKDFQQSPQSTNGFETIEFVVPVDLEALQIAVNFYGGEAPDGVNGELRVSVAGHTYATKFHLATETGNLGRFVQQSLNQGFSDIPETVIFKPLSIVAH